MDNPEPADDYLTGLLDGLDSAVRMIESCAEVVEDHQPENDHERDLLAVELDTLLTIRQMLMQDIAEAQIEGGLFCTCGHDECEAPKKPQPQEDTDAPR